MRSNAYLPINQLVTQFSSEIITNFACRNSLLEMKEKNLYMLEAEDMVVLADLIATKLMAKMGHTSINAHADEDELIGTKEACLILGCCPKTMQSYRNRKLFRVVMRGPKKAMYFKSEILAFRAANTRPSRDSK